VKTRRLSEIDLARLASLTNQEELELSLRRYNAGGTAWSYNPVRASNSDILGATTPLHGVLPPVPWSKIEQQIVAASTRGAHQAASNVEVGKVLFDAARRMGWSAANYEMGRLSIGIGESVSYWCNVVLADEGGPFIPFFDHRRNGGVSNAAIRQIVFSMQSIWVRDRHPDLAEARLAVIQFPPNRDGRSVRVHFHNEAELLPYEVLDARVRNVYVTWARMSDEKARGGRGTGTGGPGDLFG